MTSPGPDHPVPPNGYTAQTIHELQEVDPDALGRARNTDMHGQLEGVRGNLFNGLLGGFGSVPAALVPIISGIFNGWNGGGSVGDPLEVQYTIEQIKDAVINGYNVETKVTSGAWAKPATLNEIVVIAIGGGETGQNGQGTAGASTGGRGGGYLAQQLDPATIAASTPYVIGTANNSTSFGSHVSTIPGVGGMSTQFGYTETQSMPGNGGLGGRGGTSDFSPTAGTPGSSSVLAAGGAGGNRGTSGSDAGQPGVAGGNVSAGTTTKCGGAGGGGGGGGQLNLVGFSGGPGGPGGYPGGGGGGGGGRSGGVGSATNGAGGIGATGVLWIFWR
ncbi:minor tail protein [Gordonia phage EMoore]|uniref:Minor tail protein n=1 Tax=Gordonia phage EMoore TaxID=2656534 RepID=A0A649VV86_9CAUD|nr:minor tail protein [Gordonia phage EMoore]QGJ95819.1 minor tail protein [Gordonia phage EMoore]